MHSICRVINLTLLWSLPWMDLRIAALQCPITRSIRFSLKLFYCIVSMILVQLSWDKRTLLFLGIQVTQLVRIPTLVILAKWKVARRIYVHVSNLLLEGKGSVSKYLLRKRWHSDLQRLLSTEVLRSQGKALGGMILCSLAWGTMDCHPDTVFWYSSRPIYLQKECFAEQVSNLVVW